MDEPQKFEFLGDYRVQSRASAEPSILKGYWVFSHHPQHLSQDRVNAALTQNSYWLGKSSVSIRSANINFRSGEFEKHPDILYKKSNFVPIPSSQPMASNIVDIEKARTNWEKREKYVQMLIGQEAASVLADLLGPRFARVVANEYFVHEVGHALGYPTEAKYEHGYFRVGGRTLWPLVYMEELRADLLSFFFAAELLDADEAAAIFLYNVFLRFGVHHEGVLETGNRPYGSIPEMLFVLLRKIGWLTENRRGVPNCLRFTSLKSHDLVTVMKSCAKFAFSRLLDAELAARSATDAALASAKCYNELISDVAAVEEFGRFFGAQTH